MSELNKSFDQAFNKFNRTADNIQDNFSKLIENSERMTEILQEMSKFLEEKNGDE